MHRLNLAVMAGAVILWGAAGGTLAAEVAVVGGAVAPPQAAVVDFNTCAKPEWPKQSLRLEEQGRVTLAFLIGVDGAVRDAKVVKSSGFPLLDIAASEGIAKCKFKAASVNGQPTETWMKMQYVWTLRDGSTATSSAVADYQKRAEAGEALAQFELAKLYLNGSGVERQRDTGAKWMRRAAEQGHAEAQASLAMLLMMPGPDGRSPEEAAGWMMKAAEQGNARAQGMYGAMLVRGTGLPRDARAGLDWLTRSAQADVAEAQGLLGVHLLKEHPERAEEAVGWLKKGAQHNDALALMALGDLYDKGKIVAADRAQAIALYSKAAQAGNAAAMLRLAERYERGDGVPADPDRASQLRATALLRPPVR